jgi:hypothetical protein
MSKKLKIFRVPVEYGPVAADCKVYMIETHSAANAMKVALRQFKVDFNGIGHAQVVEHAIVEINVH